MIISIKDNCNDSTELTYKIWFPWYGNQPNSLTELKDLPDTLLLNCDYLGTQKAIVFVVDKKGDLNNSATASELTSVEKRNNSTLFETATDQFLQKGKTYTIPFSFPASQPLAGYQLSSQTNNLYAICNMSMFF